MKVIQKKSVKDLFIAREEFDYLTLNPLNKAITDYYLPRWDPSPLKSFLLKQFGTLKNLYLCLKVTCEKDGKTVSSLALCFNLLDDWERDCGHFWGLELDREAIGKCMETYFKSIGYCGTVCTNAVEICSFLQRLVKDVPLADEYFEMSNSLNQ